VRTRSLLLDGCLLLIVSFGVHAFGSEFLSALGFGPDTWMFQTKVALKHAAELSGWVMVAVALALPAAA
jgi:hypothetical protein